jgi:ASC-1-like (ASCH) protein
MAFYLFTTRALLRFDTILFDLQEGAGGQAFLRSLYQAAWLQREDALKKVGHHEPLEKLRSSLDSLQAMQESFKSFRTEAQEKGWDVDKVLYQLPPSSSLVGSSK